MSANYRQLLALSDDDLIAAHDEMAVCTSVGVDFYLQELRRREQARSNAVVVKLTYANTALAAIAVVIAVVSILLR